MMNQTSTDTLSYKEKREFLNLASQFGKTISGFFPENDIERYKDFVRKSFTNSTSAHDSKGIPEAILTLNTAQLFATAIEPDHNILLAIGLYPFLKEGITNIMAIRKEWGEDIA